MVVLNTHLVEAGLAVAVEVNMVRVNRVRDVRVNRVRVNRVRRGQQS